jgi:hypothetical protein
VTPEICQEVNAFITSLYVEGTLSYFTYYLSGGGTYHSGYFALDTSGNSFSLKHSHEIDYGSATEYWEYQQVAYEIDGASQYFMVVCAV